MNQNSIWADIKPWKTIESRIVFQADPWLRVVADDVLLPDGRRVDNFLRLEAPDFAAIVPINEHDEIGLLRSYKHGVGGIDLQPPAGYIEPNEDPLAAAKRELLEETGCCSQRWKSLGSFVVGGNRGAGHAHLFLATGCRKIAEPNSGDLEEQDLHWIPRSEVQRRWMQGEFQQLAAIAALGMALAHLGSNTPTLDQPTTS